MTPNHLYGAFLSHAEADVDRAVFIRDTLNRHGIEARTHDDFLRKSDSREAMDSSACVVFLLTPSARRSERLLDALIYARSKFTGHILALLMAGDVRSALPYGLMTWPVTDMRSSPARALERLITTIWDIEGLVGSAVDIPRIPEFAAVATPDVRPQKRHDVYLSYRHLDKQHMPAIRDVLLNGGLTVWVDELITPGGDWRTEIENALDAARTVVVLLSKNVTESSWVLEDITYAEAHDIPIFPVALDNSPYGTDAPYDLSDRSFTNWYIDAPEDERAANLERLVAGIKATLKKQAPTDSPHIVFVPDPGIGNVPLSEKSYDVFLSYSRKDTALMLKARDTLRSAGFRVWTDEALEPGTPSWEAEVEQALRDTLTVVALLSPDSAESEWVRRELAFAEEQKVRILPILVRGEPSAAVPIRLTATQRIDGRTDYDGALARLVNGLNRLKSSL